MFELDNIPFELAERANAPLLTGILRGIEREALRVDAEGNLSVRPHPRSLGSALSHPMITTDFSEALLEFITPPTHRIEDLFFHLDNIHRFTLDQLDGEILWTSSMPCLLPANENDIPVAQYGSSNNGMMKTVYRLGLGHRYGRAMQTVAGIHYNFSLPNAFWAHFHTKENSLLSLEEYKNQRYFAMIRNFRRHFWLLILLFGASPAMCSSFVGERNHALEVFPGNKALYLPYATSLRMGDLGYQSNAQESLFVCYNQKETYIQTLSRAILTPYQGYKQIGLRDATGAYRQLGEGLLQIENEFYSAIRPKRSAQPGETALMALKRRGVEYIEVRCLDIDPFNPLGISPEHVAFLDTFLLYCALKESALANNSEFKMVLSNQKTIVNRGREPGITLEHPEFGELAVDTWAKALLAAMEPVANLLDTAFESDNYSRALTKQRMCTDDLSLTPSARLLTALESSDKGYAEMSLALSHNNNQQLREQALDDQHMMKFRAIAEESLAEQTAIEANTSLSFDKFLAEYFKQYQTLL